MEWGKTKGGRGMQPFSTLFFGLSFYKTLSDINKIHTFVNRELYKPFPNFQKVYLRLFSSLNISCLCVELTVSVSINIYEHVNFLIRNPSLINFVTAREQHSLSLTNCAFVVACLIFPIIDWLNV